MNHALVRRQSSRGITLVEILIAGLLMSIGMMGLISTWLFSYRVTANTDDIAIGYNLGRYTLERVKYNGFPTAAEGTSTAYFDNNQVNVGATSTRRFQVVTSVVSDLVKSGTSGQSGAVPADNALRTVTVTVTLYSTGQTLFTSTTYLARSGI